MRPAECEYEAEVLAAVLQSRWPENAEPDLREHVAGCQVCSEVVLVAWSIGGAREEMRSSVVVPDSGRVWWRAQLRARREAVKAAGRPITVAQVAAFACAMGLLGACFGAMSTWFQSLVARVQAMLPSTVALIAEHSVLALVVAALVSLIPAALYFTVVKE
jgi:hypothetical protein